MYRVIPDERPLVEKTIVELVGHVLHCVRPARTSMDHADHCAGFIQCDKEGCCFVVTTGGTGPSPRDVTPEATEAVRMHPVVQLHSCFRRGF